MVTVGAVVEHLEQFAPPGLAADWDNVGLLLGERTARVRRVMTSGQQPTAMEGAPCIAQLIDRAAGRMEVLPAGGIRPWNVRELVAKTGCGQVHASLREPRKRGGGDGISLSRVAIAEDATSSPMVRKMADALRET